VDFCSPRRKLIIELDGSQHLDQAEYDLERTQYLEAKGYRVLRFWNKDIMNDIETAMNTIWNEINKVP
jgi:very-short-patch-repair endonuclease